MDTSQLIAHNLTEWMKATPSLNTLQKVSVKAGIGFGTIRRAKNGDGNTTVQNIEAIARAFKRRPEDLFHPLPADGSVMALPMPPDPEPLPYPLDKILMAARALSKEGQLVLLGRVEEMAARFPALPAKRRLSL